MSKKDADDILIDENIRLRKALNLATAWIYDTIGTFVERKFEDKFTLTEIDHAEEILREISAQIKGIPDRRRKPIDN